MIEESLAKTPSLISDKELKYWQKIARNKAIRFTRINAFGASGLTVGELMNLQIRGTGMTAEDISQELWIEAINMRLKAESKNPYEVAAFVFNAIEWKSNMLARDMFAKKRGNEERHIAGEDAEFLFNSIPTEYAENE